MVRLLRCSRLSSNPATYAVDAASPHFVPSLPRSTSRRAVALPICAALAQQELRQRAASFGNSSSAPSKQAASSAPARGGRGARGGGRGGRGAPGGGRGGRGGRGDERQREGGASQQSTERGPKEEAVPSEGQRLIDAAATERGVRCWLHAGVCLCGTRC